jgi:hypothetical protein
VRRAWVGQRPLRGGEGGVRFRRCARAGTSSLAIPASTPLQHEPWLTRPPASPHHTCRSAWGVLVSFEKVGKQKQQPSVVVADESGAHGDGSDFKGSSCNASSGPRFAVDVLVNCDPSTLPRATGGQRMLPRLLPPGDPAGAAHVVTFPLEHLAAVSSARLRGITDLRSAQVGADALRRRGRVCITPGPFVITHTTADAAAWVICCRCTLHCPLMYALPILGSLRRAKQALTAWQRCCGAKGQVARRSWTLSQT